MKKRVFGKKLSRGGGARKALFRSLVRALTLSGKIVTTKAKAKAVIPEIEKIVTLAKSISLSNDRRIASFFRNDRKIASDFVKLARSFGNKKGGFTRYINLPSRMGDAAQMVRLEWTEKVVSSDKKKETSDKKKKKEEKEVKK